MIAQLKRLHSPDIYDLESYVPEDENCFGLFIQAMFGPHGEDGEESFGIIVCTPSWLDKELETGTIMVGRHHIFVKKYNYRTIRDFISSIATRCEGETWKDIADHLSRYGSWEFEDYTS